MIQRTRQISNVLPMNPTSRAALYIPERVKFFGNDHEQFLLYDGNDDDRLLVVGVITPVNLLEENKSGMRMECFQ